MTMFFLSGPDLYSLGYFGILVLSLLASLVVFVPIPYLAVIVLASLSGKFDLTLLAISSALGAALGKLIIFQASFAGQRFLKPNTRANFDSFLKIFSRFAWLAVLVAAATPVPDDIVYVPLGLAKYNRPKFFVSTLLGKMVLTLTIVFGSDFLSNRVLGFFIGGETQSIDVIVVLTVLFVIITILITYLISKANWERFGRKHITGWRNQ